MILFWGYFLKQGIGPRLWQRMVFCDVVQTPISLETVFQ